MLIISHLNFSQAQVSGILTEENEAAIHQIEDTLGVLAFAIVNDSFPDNRFAAVRKFIPTLVKALKVENSFNYKFDRLSTISILYPPDSTFRIFTWQLYVDVDEYRYYGAIQMNDSQLKLFPLRDRSFELRGNLEQMELSPERWYGAVYYNIVPLETAQGKHYLLFGYDRYELFRKRKVMDVLKFDEGGNAIFGASVIPHANNQTKKRLLLEYSAEASIRLNYDEGLELIIFDHLIPMAGNYGEGQVNVSDGSYEAFEITPEGLSFISKVFDQVIERPLMPYPLYNGSKDKKSNLIDPEKKKNN